MAHKDTLPETAGCSAFSQGRGLSTTLSILPGTVRGDPVRDGTIEPASPIIRAAKVGPAVRAKGAQPRRTLGNVGGDGAGVASAIAHACNDPGAGLSLQGEILVSPGGAARLALDGHKATARLGWQAAARSRSAKRDDGLVIASYLAVSPDGRLVQLCIPGVGQEPPRRGECNGMSEDSQRRLLVLLHSIRRDAQLPVMVTLTFPSEFTVTPDEAKACRKAWEKRMTDCHGQRWCAVWRLEAHPEMSRRLGRVHPHFHLLTWGAFYDFAEVSRSWQETVWSVLKVDADLRDADGRLVREKHIAAGTNCERVRKWEGVVYCTKSYLAKAEEFPLGKAGRVWGWCNRKALPIAEEIHVPLTAYQAYKVRKEVEAWMDEKKIKSEHLICTFFDANPSAFADRLLRTCGIARPRQPMPERPRR